MLLAAELSPLVQTLGRFHIVVLHLPIGLLPALAVLEFGAAIFRRELPRGAILTLSLLTALAAGAALGTGLVLAAEKVDTATLGSHKNWAIAMTAVCALLPIMAALKSRRPIRLGIATALILSVFTGHLGGSLTHGKEFLFSPIERAMNKDDGSGEGTADGADGNGGGPPQADLQSRFQREVAPIFKRVCTSCHNGDDFDGDLDLTTQKGILTLDRDEDERVIQPGKPDDSLLLELCELPADDEDRMPPEDEDQPTKAELETLRKWIADGCPFE